MPVRPTGNNGKGAPVKTERTHEENQERAYIAASRRSDRSIEARVESARRASEIHERRTGKRLRVTEQDVINEEMYEEEDDLVQRINNRQQQQNQHIHQMVQYGVTDTSHLMTQDSNFNERLVLFIQQAVGTHDAMDMLQRASQGLLNIQQNQSTQPPALMTPEIRNLILQRTQQLGSPRGHYAFLNSPPGTSTPGGTMPMQMMQRSFNNQFNGVNNQFSAPMQMNPHFNPHGQHMMMSSPAQQGMMLPGFPRSSLTPMPMAQPMRPSASQQSNQSMGGNGQSPTMNSLKREAPDSNQPMAAPPKRQRRDVASSSSNESGKVSNKSPLQQMHTLETLNQGMSQPPAPQMPMQSPAMPPPQQNMQPQAMPPPAPQQSMPAPAMPPPQQGIQPQQQALVTADFNYNATPLSYQPTEAYANSTELGYGSSSLSSSSDSALDDVFNAGSQYEQSGPEFDTFYDSFINTEVDFEPNWDASFPSQPEDGN